MDPGLKQRLVGAVVLVALAVIFLPMLLDGSGARQHLDEEIEIPPKPEPPESQLAPKIPDTPGGSQQSESPEAVSAPSGADSATADDAGAEAAESPDPVETTEPAPDTGAPAGADDGGAAGADIEQGWVVQVGSFRRETNALVLRDKLRQDGFKAYAERFGSGGDTLWRVRLGPVAERAEGEALERRIEDQRGSDALLMEYP